jgi:RNA polymerase sigma factor (sigma-70 family)
MENNSLFHSSEKYINAFVKNDRTLLNELYEKFRPMIRCMVLQNNGTESDADDILQDALLALYCKAKTGKLVIKEFDNFFYGVCKHKLLDKLNSEKKFLKGAMKDLNYYSGADNFEAYEDHRLYQQRLELVAEKFAELGVRCKELLYLSWKGISLTEVAVKLNVSYSYCRKNKSESIKRLKTLVRQSSKFELLK